jgi:uncharacterized membrane protein
MTALTLGYIASAAIYVWLPVVSVRPGQAVPFGRPLLAFLLPTAALLVSVMLGSLWRRDPIRGRSASDEATYQAITLRIVLFILAIHAAVVSGLLSVAGVIPPIAPGLARGVPMLLGIGLISVGNLLPRMKPNLIIGIRTAGTLANPGLWMRTNRMAGYVSVGLGIVLIAAGALMTPGRAVAPVVGAAGLAAVTLLVAYTSTRSRV